MSGKVESVPGGISASSAPPVDFRLDEAFKVKAMKVLDYTGPYKHLWNLLSGATRVVTPSIIYDDLRRREKLITSVLTQYREVKHTDLEEPADIRGKLTVRIMQKYNISEYSALEILCTYIGFEYNGLVIALEKLLRGPQAQSDFLKSIDSFYKRERLCLIYCSQLILSNAVDDIYTYQEVLGGFISSVHIEKWTRSLCLSLKFANSEEERIELLHALALVVYNYSSYINVIKFFQVNYTRIRDEYLTHGIRLAEAVLFFAYLQCGTEEDDVIISQFMAKELEILKVNDYVIVPILAYFHTRHKKSDHLKTLLLQSLGRKSSISYFIKLVRAYSVNGTKYRHGVGYLALRCGFTALETILKHMHVDTLASQEEFFELLVSFLKNKEIACLFLCEQPENITSLYEDALSQFPISLEILLSVWNSVARTSNDEISPLEILEKSTQLENLAEYLVYIDQRDLTFLEKGVVLNTERVVSGLIIPAGTKGTIINNSKDINKPIISWPLQRTCTSETVWHIINRVLLRPAVHGQNISENIQEKILCLAEFLVEFGDFSSELPAVLLQLFPAVANVLRRLQIAESDMPRRCNFAAVLLRIVSIGSKFEVGFLAEQAIGLWPVSGEPSIVKSLIVGHESMSNSDFSVTKVFLKSILDILFTGDKDGNTSLSRKGSSSPNWKNELYQDGVEFLVKEIFPSFVRWRFAQTKDKYEILHGCLSVFHYLFNLGDQWNPLKMRVCTELVQPNSSLLALLNTDEEILQDCRVRLTEANICLEDTMHLGLSLLLRLINFEPRTIRFLDTSSGSALTRNMARLFRHRVIVTVPLLAIKLLTKIAQDLNMSILACIGSQVETFRDLVLQRLDNKSEDTTLRIGILEFLAVCVQAQAGLMDHFLEDTFLANRIFSVLEEEDATLPPAALALIRVLVGRGNRVLNSSERWKLVMDPINYLERYDIIQQREIVTYTMNILSFELYRDGGVDEDLSSELENILKMQPMQNILSIALEDPEEGYKSLLGIKHLLTLILSKPELSSRIPKHVVVELSKLVTFEFWRNKTREREQGLRSEIRPALAEMMLLFAVEQKQTYLEKLAAQLASEFFSETLALQIPILACLNKLVSNLKNEILSASTVEYLVTIISRIFENVTKVYEADDGPNAQPLLSLAASLAYNITHLHRESSWYPVFHHKMLIWQIVNVAHIGLLREVGPEVVVECLSTLIKLCQSQVTAAAVRSANLTKNLWVPALNYGSSETDRKWTEVYLMCCELNAILISTEKLYYIDEAFNFWAFHGAALAYKLYDFVDIVGRFLGAKAEKNYDQLYQSSTFSYHTLHSVSVMLPYLARWRVQQNSCVAEIMGGVFSTLQAAVKLLTQPNHLLMVITRDRRGSSGSIQFRLSPQLLDIQTKLWDVMLMGVLIYLKLQKTGIIMVDCLQMNPLILHIINLPVKILSKHDNKKFHPVINSVSKVVMTLEKALTLLYYRVTHQLAEPTLSMKMKQAFRRESTIEITSICDSIKRLSFPNSDYSFRICTLLETIFKDIPS